MFTLRPLEEQRVFVSAIDKNPRLNAYVTAIYLHGKNNPSIQRNEEIRTIKKAITVSAGLMMLWHKALRYPKIYIIQELVFFCYHH